MDDLIKALHKLTMFLATHAYLDEDMQILIPKRSFDLLGACINNQSTEQYFQHYPKLKTNGVEEIKIACPTGYCIIKPK